MKRYTPPMLTSFDVKTIEILQSSNRQKTIQPSQTEEEKREHEEWRRSLEEKTRSRGRIPSMSKNKDLSQDIIQINTKSGNFLFDKTTQRITVVDRSYKFEDLMDFEARNNQNQTITGGEYVTKTNTGSMVGRAVVGGILTGGVGAIIGGATASKDTIKTADSKITTRNDCSIVFYFKGCDPKIIYLGNNISDFDVIVTLLRGIMLNNASNQSKMIASHRLSDELLKLADLKDKGILTEEEFQVQKKKLLDM